MAEMVVGLLIAHVEGSVTPEEPPCQRHAATDRARLDGIGGRQSA